MSHVLALKYRPKNFDDLIGQDNISQTLALALDSNRLSNAYLLSGLRGSGKTSTARILAKSMLCEAGISSKPCEVCSSCLSANGLKHIDIIEMDGASNRKIDDIRELIEQTKYKPALSRFKVFIIDEVHMLTNEAFNALLKTLEEPPQYVKFILATTDPMKLPPTILSRTQHFRFKRVPNSLILNHLEHILNLEAIEYEQEAIKILARSGSGSLRDTITLLDQAIIYSKGYIKVSNVVSMLGVVDPEVTKQIFEAIFAKERTKLLEMIALLKDEDIAIVIDEMIIYIKEALFNKDINFSLLTIDRFFSILNGAKSLLAQSADGEFVLSLTLFKMLEALKLKNITDEIAKLEEALQNEPDEVQKITPMPKAEPKKDNFNQLIDLIYDRNFALGECFEQNVTFVSFEENVLTWESRVEGECKERLKRHYSIVRHFVQKVYGVHTKIKAQKKEQSEPAKEMREAPHESAPSAENQNMQSASSCVAQVLDVQAKNVDNIMNEPAIQTVQELFEIEDINVTPKV